MLVDDSKLKELLSDEPLVIDPDDDEDNLANKDKLIIPDDLNSMMEVTDEIDELHLTVPQTNGTDAPIDQLQSCQATKNLGLYAPPDGNTEPQFQALRDAGRDKFSIQFAPERKLTQKQLRKIIYLIFRNWNQIFHNVPTII